MSNAEVAIERYHRSPLPTSRQLLATLSRQRWPMLIAFAVVMIAVALSGLWIPTYEARMKILVRKQRADAVVTSASVAPTQLFNDQVSEEDLNSEVELLNSDDLLRKVVLATGLVGRENPSPGKNDEVRIAKAVRNLGKSLKIDAIRKTNVISVRYQTTNPALAAKVLNELSTAYREKHLEVHRSSGEFTFFDQQLEQYEKTLEAARAKLTEFTENTGIVSASQERDAALREANEFDANARQARTALTETENRVSALRAQLQGMQPRVTTVVRSSDNPQVLGQLDSTLLSLKLKRTELLTKYAPTYRLVQEVDQQIADTEIAIKSEEKKPFRDETTEQNPDYKWVQAELTKAQADLSGLSGRVAAAEAIAAQYHQAAERLDKNGQVQQDLERTVKMQEENYLLYQHKREEARISDALDQRGILNVAMAEQPVVPALPSKSPIVVTLLTLVLACTVSLSTAFVVDLAHPSFRTASEVSAYLGTPVLAALTSGEE